MRVVKIVAGIGVLLGFLAVFSVGFLEVGLRLKSKLLAKREAAQKDAPVAQLPRDPKINAPIYQMREFLTMYNQPMMRMANVTTNSRGFRGTRELEMPKPAGRTRVFVIGGSAAVGFNASNDDATMPAQLEKILKDKLRNENLEVVNAACAGFSSTQDLVLMATEVMLLQPDLIVAFGGGTDINISMYPQWRHGYNEGTSIFESREFHPWHDHSHAIKFLSAFTKPKKTPKAKGAYHPEVAKDYAANLKLMADLAAGAGIPFLNVLQPALLVSTKDRSPEEHASVDAIDSTGLAWGYQDLVVKLYPLVREELKTLRLPKGSHIVDASDLFAGRPEHLFSDAFHLTDAGYRVAAEKVSDVILTEKLLTNSPTREVASRRK